MKIALLMLSLLFQVPNTHPSRVEQLRWHRHSLQNPQHGQPVRTTPRQAIVPVVLHGELYRVRAGVAEAVFDALKAKPQLDHDEQALLAALVVALGTRPPVARRAEPLAIPVVYAAGGDPCDDARAACKEGSDAYYDGCRAAGGSAILCWFKSEDFRIMCTLGAGCPLLG